MTACRFEVYRYDGPAGRGERGTANPPGKPQFEGIVATDGTVAIRWLTKAASWAIFGSWGEMTAVHGHPEYGTEIRWLDPPPFCEAKSRNEHTCPCRPCGFKYHCGQHDQGCHQQCPGAAPARRRPASPAALSARVAAKAAFRDAMVTLYEKAGEPDTRRLAIHTGIPRATVEQVISGRKVPGWRITSRLVTQLGGDQEEFRILWKATRPGPAITPPEGSAS
jgi:hypothetical protein